MKVIELVLHPDRMLLRLIAGVFCDIEDICNRRIGGF